MGKHRARTTSSATSSRTSVRFGSGRRRTVAGTAAVVLLASLLTGWPGADAATPPVGEAYVANFGSGGISQFGTYATGIAIGMPYPTAPGDLTPSSVAIPVSGKFVYSQDCTSGNIRQYTVDTAGLLIGTLVPMLPPVAAGTYRCTNSYPHPGHTLAVTKSGAFVLAIGIDAATHNNAVFSFKVATTGALTPVGMLDVPAPSFESIAVAPNNKFVYAIDVTGSITQLTLSTTGALSAPHKFAANPGVTDAAVSPSGKNLYAVSFVTDTVDTYAVNLTTGALTFVNSVFTGQQPTQLAIAPNAKSAYVANSGDDTVSQYKVGTTGLLTALSPASVDAGSGPTAIAVNATSKFVYVVNSGDSSLASYSVDATTLQLTLMGSAPTGANPWGLAVRK